MMEFKDTSEELNKRIEEIQNKVLTGKIKLLDLELVPIFDDLKNLITIDNLKKSSKTYEDACGLLNQKFDELKKLLQSLDNETKFLRFLKTNPNDLQISLLFDGCWIKTFNIDALSLKFLKFSKDRLCKEKGSAMDIEHLEKIEVKENFFLEIPKQKFSEKMMIFFNNSKKLFPCPFDDIFGEEQDQSKIYEKFVYLLHLLQLNKIKYQKETNYLYI